MELWEYGYAGSVSGGLGLEMWGWRKGVRVTARDPVNN